MSSNINNEFRPLSRLFLASLHAAKGARYCCKYEVEAQPSTILVYY